MCTNKKPLETNSTFPESLLNSQNDFDLFLNKDQQKLAIFSSFKKLNRDLTQAFLRQPNAQVSKDYPRGLSKVRQRAMLGSNPKQNKKDEEVFDKVTGIF